MSQAIDGAGRQFPPSTTYSQTLVLGADLPAGGPQPPPSTVQAAFNDSNLSVDTFTQSKAATVLISSTATQASPAAAAPAVAPAAVAQTPSAPTQAQNPSISVVSQDATANASPLQEFEQSQGPPPYTLRSAQPDPNKENAQPLQAQPLNPFQIRQFSDLLKTIRSITSSVLPNFSFSA